MPSFSTGTGTGTGAGGVCAWAWHTVAAKIRIATTVEKPAARLTSFMKNPFGDQKR